MRGEAVGLEDGGAPAGGELRELAAHGAGRRDEREAQAGEVGRMGRGRGDRHAEGEGERGPAAGFAGEADLAAEERDEVAADGEAQAGAAVFARGAGVELVERPEQLRGLLRRDADAGVAHTEAQETGAGRREAGCGRRGFFRLRPPVAGHLGLGRDGDRDLDLAGLGELHGVVDEVGQDLAQAAAVHDDGRGHVVGDGVEQLEFLLGGACGEEVERVLDAFARVARRRLELELARLDAGVVEDVAGERDERLAAGADGLDEVALLGGELGAEEEVGEADDAVERRADLVAHGGEELALGAVARLREVAGLAQLGLAAFRVGDVVERGDEAGERAVAVLHGRDDAVHGIGGAVLAAVEPLALPGAAGAHGGDEVGERVGGGLGLAEFAPVAADELAARVADLLAEAVVGVFDAALEVHDHERGVALLHRGGEVADCFALLARAAQQQQRAPGQAERRPHHEGPGERRAPRLALPARGLDAERDEIFRGPVGIGGGRVADQSVAHDEQAKVVGARPGGGRLAGAERLAQARCRRHDRIVVTRQRLARRAGQSRIGEKNDFAGVGEDAEDVHETDVFVGRAQAQEPLLDVLVGRPGEVVARAGELAQGCRVERRRAAPRVVEQLVGKRAALAAPAEPAGGRAGEQQRSPDGGDGGAGQTVQQHGAAQAARPHNRAPRPRASRRQGRR